MVEPALARAGETDVEQQPSELPAIGEEAGEPVDFGHHEGVAVAAAASASRRPGRVRPDKPVDDANALARSSAPFGSREYAP
jgi:hypothetical protein